MLVIPLFRSIDKHKNEQNFHNTRSCMNMGLFLPQRPGNASHLLHYSMKLTLTNNHRTAHIFHSASVYLFNVKNVSNIQGKMNSNVTAFVRYTYDKEFNSIDLFNQWQQWLFNETVLDNASFNIHYNSIFLSKNVYVEHDNLQDFS